MCESVTIFFSKSICFINVDYVISYRDELKGGYTLHSIGATPYGLISPEKTTTIISHISCHVVSQKPTTKRNVFYTVAVDDVVIRDLHGHL